MEPSLLKAAFLLTATGLFFLLAYSPSRLFTKILRLNTDTKHETKKVL